MEGITVMTFWIFSNLSIWTPQNLWENAFQSDYEASLHKLFFCLRKPQLWTPLSPLYLTIPLFSLFFSLYHTSFILPTSHPTSIPILLLTPLPVSQETIYKSLLDFFHFSPSKHKKVPKQKEKTPFEWTPLLIFISIW